MEFIETDAGTHVAVTHTSLVDQDDVERHATGWNGMLTSLARLSAR